MSGGPEGFADGASIGTVRGNPAVSFGDSWLALIDEDAGGSGNFAWSLSQESWGTLSARTGDTTVYTSLHSASTNTTDVQLLTVTSADESFSAYIKHKADSSSQNGDDDPPPIP